MAVFPLFIDLKGKRCVIIGAGRVAERKIETLLEFSTDILVISPETTERIQQLKWEDKLVVIKKRYSEEDIEGAFMVIAATSDSKVNEKIYCDAVKRNIFVNVVDNPERCTFIFPSVVKRGELVVGISTSGSYPVLSKKIREKINSVLPKKLGSMVQTLKECRKRAEQQIPDSCNRKELLDKIADEIIFYEEAVSEKQLKIRIDNIFEEYKNDKEN